MAQSSLQSFVESLIQVSHVIQVILHLLKGNAGSLAETDAQARRQSTGTKSLLLTATVDDGQKTNARLSSDVECTDALRAINLVTRDRQQVNVHLVDVDRHLAEALGGVSVEESLVSAAHRTNLLDGLLDSDLVVHVDNGTHERVRSQSCLQLVKIDEAGGEFDGKVGDLEAHVLKTTATVEHALMIDLSRDDVLLPVLIEQADTLEAQVVRFGRTRRKYDLFGLSADDVSNVLSGILARVLGVPAELVGLGVRVAIVVGHVGHHGVENARVRRCR